MSIDGAMTVRERLFGRILEINNQLVRRGEGECTNPRSLDQVPWHGELVASFGGIRAEWEHFERTGGRVPLIEEVIDEHQGNTGSWRMGLLVSRGRPREPLASEFPVTIAALRTVPGIRSALWSVMEAGTELPEHVGPNGGVLRYHLGVRCPDDCALRVGDTIVPYRDGTGVFFDDTEPHAAWNRSEDSRVTLFCEVERPVPRLTARVNHLVQGVISLDARYRRAPERAAAWHAEQRARSRDGTEPYSATTDDRPDPRDR